jgi:hypothetical protein
VQQHLERLRLGGRVRWRESVGREIAASWPRLITKLAMLRLLGGVGLRRSGLSIVPDDSTAGRCHTRLTLGQRPDVNTSDRVRLRAERQAVVLLAGMEAQRKYNPRTVRNYHGRPDYRDALDLIEYFVQSNEELEAYPVLGRGLLELF